MTKTIQILDPNFLVTLTLEQMSERIELSYRCHWINDKVRGTSRLYTDRLYLGKFRFCSIDCQEVGSIRNYYDGSDKFMKTLDFFLPGRHNDIPRKIGKVYLNMGETYPWLIRTFTELSELNHKLIKIL